MRARISLGVRLRGGDLSLTRRMNRWAARALALRVFSTVSRLGDGSIWIALLLLLPLVDRRGGLPASAHVGVTALVALVIYTALKRLTRRPRPFRAGTGVVAHVPPLDEYSFPSGHTLHAVSISLVACAHYPVLMLLLGPFTVLVAASRVVLGLHYPSDVLAASVIGGALGVVSCRIGFSLLGAPG